VSAPVFKMTAPLSYSDEVDERYEGVMLATHGAGIARHLLERAGVKMAADLEIEPESAGRFLAAQREQRRSKASGEEIEFLEALRRLEKSSRRERR
jgi:hypothetical protein